MTRFPHDDVPERDDDLGDAAELALPADPQFDAWLARQAPSIHAPPATPREDMWKAIQSAQRTNGAAPASAVPGVRPLHRRWPLPAAIAAALLLGIAIDRIAVQSGETTLTRPSSRIAAAPAHPERTDSVTQSVQAPQHDTANEADGAKKRPRAAMRVASTAVTRNAPPTTLNAPPATLNAPPTTLNAPPTTQNAPLPTDSTDVSRLYRLAAVQTLSQAEALLTSYRATDLAMRNPAAAQQLGSLGREVLSSTRLLIDSPAGRDPRLRPLLGDLELVLVQIVRLSGAPLDASDRALIDRALRDRDLLPRIRTAVPAGAASTSSDEEE